MNSSNNNIFFFFSSLLRETYDSRKSKKLSSFKEAIGTKLINCDLDKGIIEFEMLDFENPKNEIEINVFDFNKAFEQELKGNTIKCIEEIDIKVQEITITEKKPNEFLKLLQNQIIHLSEKLNDSTYSGVKSIFIALNSISEHISKRYNIQKRQLNKLSEENYLTSFFGIKPTVKRSKISDLYEIAEELNILNYEIVNESDFIEVLTRNPLSSKAIIQFACNNQLAVHFINCISPLFNNLTFSKVSQSESFYNKRGKLLTQGDLDSANTNLKKKAFHKKSQLSEVISILLSEH